MITIRTEDNLMVTRLEDMPEKIMLRAIAEGIFQVKTAAVTDLEKYSKAYILTEDQKLVHEGFSLFLWKGTRILVD